MPSMSGIPVLKRASLRLIASILDFSTLNEEYHIKISIYAMFTSPDQRPRLDEHRSIFVMQSISMPVSGRLGRCPGLYRKGIVRTSYGYRKRIGAGLENQGIWRLPCGFRPVSVQNVCLVGRFLLIPSYRPILKTGHTGDRATQVKNGILNKLLKASSCLCFRLKFFYNAYDTKCLKSAMFIVYM